MSKVGQSNEDRVEERKWFINHLSYGLRKEFFFHVQKDFVERQKVREQWPEMQFHLFPNGNIVWNIQKIVLDDPNDWDGNLELVLVKEKLGLVQFFSLTRCNNKNVSEELLTHRKHVVSQLISKKRLCTV